jgi:hypothetical protein
MQQVLLPKGLSREGAIERIGRLLASLPLEKAWRVDIAEHKARRSDQQNRYLWGVVYPVIAKHLDGFEPIDVHEYMLGEWAGWETLEGFGKKRLRPLRRSSRLNKEEFSDYVGFIQRRAAEHGIYVPDADPMYWEHAA